MKTGDYNYFYYYCAVITIFILFTIVPVENKVAYFQNILYVIRRHVAGGSQIAGACISAPSIGYVILGKLLNPSVPQCPSVK